MAASAGRSVLAPDARSVNQRSGSWPKGIADGGGLLRGGDVGFGAHWATTLRLMSTEPELLESAFESSQVRFDRPHVNWDAQQTTTLYEWLERHYPHAAALVVRMLTDGPALAAADDHGVYLRRSDGTYERAANDPLVNYEHAGV
jgi:hypothetical protein